MTASDPLVLVGRVVGAFGVRGEVRIRSFGEDPMALLAYSPLLDASGAPSLTLTGARPDKDGVIARCKEVATKEQADAMRGLELHARRSSLPAAEEDEFYLADLIGLAAFAPDGTALGRVKDVPNYGAGDLLEVAPEGGGQTWLVAFTAETAPEIDIAGGRIVIVRPPETE